MIREEDKNKRMYRKDLTEAFTEYPFFHDGMTWGEFDKEQEAYIAFCIAGGKRWEYVSLRKQRQEGKNV